MKTVKAKNGQTFEVKWALGPLENGQVHVTLEGDVTIGETGATLEGLDEIVIDEGSGAQRMYLGYTRIASVQRVKEKNETRLVFEKP